MSDERKNLEAVLWAGADVLRSKMDANEYKDYLLAFVFYKYLSDKFLKTVCDEMEHELESVEQAQGVWEEARSGEYAEDLIEDLKSELRYIIEPEHTFTAFAKKAANSEFYKEDLQTAFNNIEQSDELFENLFQGVDLYSNKLGVGDQKQADTIQELIKVIDQADILKADGDVLGNAYEYLIGAFASETGKKAGEFYTPTGPAKILTQIAIDGQEDKRGLLVYDPCMGSASLLLDARNFSKRPQYIKYFGQELMNSTYNIARMNMLLHGIAPENQNLNLGDTLDDDWPAGEDTEFDMVVMNPPYSAKWSAKEGFKTDPRFSGRDDLAPKSKADYAFLLHGLYHLKSGGTMGIVLPHGVLFRGGSEGKIRRSLLKDGNIYAIIGLPANMFYNTSIPTCIIILKKERDDKSDAPSGESGGESENADSRDVLFIDASKLFEKKKTQNVMNNEHIKRVIELYKNRQDVDKEAHLASFAEIEENDFNLNIPRYVDTTEDEEPVRLADVNSQIAALDGEMEAERAQMLQILGSLEPLEPLEQSVDSSSGSRVGESETREQTETHEQTLAALKEFMNRIEQL